MISVTVCIYVPKQNKNTTNLLLNKKLMLCSYASPGNYSANSKNIQFIYKKWIHKLCWFTSEITPAHGILLKLKVIQGKISKLD